MRGDVGPRRPPLAPARPRRRLPSSPGSPHTSSHSLPRSVPERKLCAQLLEGARGPALYCAKGHAGSPGDLPLGESSKICQLYHFSMRRVEYFQSPRDPPREPGFVHYLLRTGRRIPGGEDVCLSIRYLMNPVGTLAVEVQGTAAGDPIKPGGEAAPRSIEGTQRAPHLQEDILDQLLS